MVFIYKIRPNELTWRMWWESIIIDVGDAS